MTISVLNAAGVPVEIEEPLPPGRHAPASSLPVVPAGVTTWGIGGVPFTSSDAQAAAAVTDAPSSGECLVIDSVMISAELATAITFLEETSGDVISGPYYLPARGVLPLALASLGMGWKLPTADKKLMVQADNTGGVMVHVGYHSEPA